MNNSIVGVFEIKKLKFSMLLVFVLFFSILLVGTAYAHDADSNQTVINDDFASIQELIDEAKPGESIHLENKTYFGSGSSIRIDKNVVIEGDSSSTVLDANNQSSIFVISPKVDVKINGLTFINGYNSTEGGAIYNSGILAVDNSKFINNYADGGAIHNAWKGKLTVSNSLFDGNNASFGAAIDNNEADLTIINTTFTNNACLEGGAIYNRFGEFLIYNCTFINNSAARGGGVYNNRGFMEIHDSRFISNNVYDLGGGIKSWGVCEVYDTIVQNNSAKQGGGIYVSEYTLLANNCLIENNNAEWGGGIYVEAKAKATVKNSIIINNSAVRGGGIDLNQGALDLTDCSVNDNVADTYGGGIYCAFLSSKIKDCEINNNAAKRGGAVYVNSQRNITVNITNVTIKNNKAQDGGAIYNRGEVNLINVSLNSNEAEQNGGAIYNRKITSIENCEINEGKAVDYGGAIYNEQDLTVDNVSFNSNEAKFGGAIYNGGLANVKNSLLDSNIAEESGGAIYNSNILFIESSEINDNGATSYGGAIYNVHDLNVDNVSFNSNEARLGGVIYGNTSMDIKNSIFNSNKAFQAGVIYSKITNLTIDNSQFIQNTVTHNAGVFYFSKGNVKIDNSIFKLNTGADEGGVIFNTRANVLVNNSQFISNDARSYGAAADNSGQLTIENSLFDNNRAYDAAVIDNAGTLIISKSKFTNNVAQTNGGVVDSKVPITVYSSVFEGNSAICGGAIYRGDAVDCLFVNCKAENGAAIYMGNATDCLFVNCSAKDHGGVIYQGSASESYCVGCHDAYDELTYPEAWSDENYNGGSYVLKSDSSFIYGYVAQFSKNPSQVTVVAKLASDATGNVEFTINGTSKKVKVKDGKAKAYFYSLSTGTYAVDIQYDGDLNYPSDSISIGIEIVVNYPIISVSSPDVGYAQDAVIKINLDENASGNLDVSVNGMTQKVNITNNTLDVSFAGLKIGSYDVTVSYPGSDRYVPQNVTSTFNVVKGTPITSVNVSNPVGFGDDAIINVKVNNVNGNVWFTLSDENRTQILTDKIHIENGAANLSIPGLGLGRYYLHLYYAGNARYNAQTIKTTFEVTKKTPISSVNVSDCAPGDNAIIKVKVNNVNGNVWFTISDENGTKILTNSCHIDDGWAIISIPGLSIGKYHVHIYYAGNVHYNAQTIKTSFEVAKISPGLTVSKTTVDGRAVLTANVAQDARGNINFNVNGTTFKAPIVKGVATVTLPDLAPGKYTLKSSYGGNYRYLAETKIRSITIK